MKKYLMTGIAALTFSGMITSCSHDMDQYTGGDVTENIQKDYETKFVSRFGEPASTQDWGFGSSSVAGVRGGTRTVPGIEIPDNFKNKTNITEPGTIQKPTINESDATIVISESQNGNQNYDNAIIYVKNNATLTLPDWASLQNTKFYLSSGCTLVVRNFYLKGNTEFVNDGGTIEAGTNNLVLENFTGTFWNNGTINVNEFKTSNGEGGDIYFGSDSELNATKLFIFKKVLLRNEGEITLTGEFNADQYGHKIYNSGTITTPKIILQKETVLWNEGTITAANNKEIENSSISNDDVQIYNGESATLKLENLKLTNNRQLVVNKGTLNVKNAIAMENNSEINNSGTLTGSSMELKSGAKFYNESGNTVTISGLTKVYNNSQNNVGNVWRNAGYFNTGSFEVTGGVAYPAAFNNCHMTVTDKFFMNEGFFVLDGGAAVECGSFEWKNNNYFHMGGKALLKVTGELLANNQNTGYGFYGDDTDYAVIQAGSVKKGSNGKFCAAYFGNIFVDTNNHFTQGEDNAQGTWYTFGDNVKFSFTDDTDVTGFQTTGAKTAQKAENFSINIPAPADNTNSCTPGYKWGTSNDVIESVRVIAEDLTINDVKADFDFNDVVFDVIWNRTQGKVSVKLLAAGGELTLYVGGTATSVKGVQPVNSLFQLANPDKTIGEKDMLNTIRPKDDPSKDYKHEYKPYLYELDNTWWSGTTINEIAKSINIHVWKGGSLVSLTAEPGKPAAKIAVGTDFDWCDERENIDAKFENFPGFVQGEYSWDTWYKNQNQNQ